MEATVAQLRGLIDVPLDMPEKVVGKFRTHMLDEIEVVCSQNNRIVKAFLGDARFRSERLEVLLMRYLEDEQVDMELVRRMDRVDRRARVAVGYREYRDSLQSTAL